MTIPNDRVVKSLGRAFEILQLFERLRKPLNATQVQRELRYPQSSTIALLKSMVALDYLTFDRSQHTYLPTLRVAKLGHWVEASFHGEGHLLALLDDLSARTSETVCLSRQNDLVMQFTHVRLSAQPLIVSSKPGDLAPLFRSAIGHAALSARPDSAIRQLGHRFNRRARKLAERVDVDMALQRIRRVRCAGYAVGYDLYVKGVGAVAWPLPADGGGITVVLSVGGPSDRLKNREASIVRTTRAALREHLGA